MKYYFAFSITFIAIEMVATTHPPTVSPAPSAEVETSNMYKSSGQEGFQSPFTIGSPLNSVEKGIFFSHNPVNSHKFQAESTALYEDGGRVVENTVISSLQSSKSSTISPAPTANAKALDAEKKNEKEPLLVDSRKTRTTSPTPANRGNKTLKVSAAGKSPVRFLTPPYTGGNINLEVESGGDSINQYKEKAKDGVKRQSLKSSKMPSVSPAPSAVGKKVTAVPKLIKSVRNLSKMSKSPTTSPAPTSQQ